MTCLREKVVLKWGQPWKQRAVQGRPARPLGPLVKGEEEIEQTKNEWELKNKGKTVKKIQSPDKDDEKSNMR